jgi:hypothetical protein
MLVQFSLNALAVVLMFQGGCGVITQSNLQTPTPNPTTSESPPETKPEYIEQADGKIIKKDGWIVPTLTSEMVVKPRTSLKVRSYRVFKTEYGPKDDFIVTATRKVFADSGLMEDEGEHWRIWSIIKFEKNDTVFCYMMKGAKVILDSDGVVKGRVATAIGLNLYDEDGDGKFETLEFASISPEIPRLPKWVSE